MCLFSLLFVLSLFAIQTYSQNSTLAPTLGSVTRFSEENLTVPINFVLANGSYDYLNFSVFPCWEFFDWYIGDPPLPPLCNFTSTNPNATVMTCTIPSPEITTYSFYIQPKFYSWLLFDMLILTSDDDFHSIVPLPGNNGRIEHSLIDGEGTNTLLISWKGTGNPLDSYEVYLNHITRLSFPVLFTGCGVETHLLKLDAPIERNGDTYSTTVNQLDKKAHVVVNVVVKRDGGYMATYEPLSVGYAVSLLIGVLPFVLSILLSL